jgi:hypothetical protein
MFETSEIDASVALRPTRGDVCAESTQEAVELLVTQIQGYDGARFDAAGQKRWLHEPQPEFMYMTRAPAFPAEIVSDYIYLHWRYTQEGREAPESITDNHFFLRDTARYSNCSIKVSHKYLRGESWRAPQHAPLQLSFRGTSSAIRLAKKMLEVS